MPDLLNRVSSLLDVPSIQAEMLKLQYRLTVAWPHERKQMLIAAFAIGLTYLL
ncbi:hypothetical protein LF1_58830 [Rubripirellula obstinata]|uniref:Uncharacterized protein n=1 Tax=Rubripirellula obstinata TaxID=406547 RepID=A0A5B1CBD4_9BACT|nr:hypothetical protein LF1_58830 [Rubripirellula obstinata]